MVRVVIGMAGHIDHGKTTLVKALTGIDTDNLKEEKARGITIELGFARIKLPSGINGTIVDVPGHERFIKTMLAGITGIDIAVLVVAADEGVMPQTREHFDILKILEIKQLLIVITKIDLVDSEILELVEEEIKEMLIRTPYEKSSILTFSVVNEEDKARLLKAIDEEIKKDLSFRKEKKITRLPIDRVFTRQGFGTVVTGTLFDGKISVGDQLYIPIKNKKIRVRNLQVNNKQVDTVQAGQRVAVNLAGVESKGLSRGDVLTEEGKMIPSQRIDGLFRLLESMSESLKNFTRIRFHQGTVEVIGRILLLDRDELLPGEEAYVQLMLEKPVVVFNEDRFVLRNYSPLYTIGGGSIVQSHAYKHKKKEVRQVLEELQIQAKGNLEDVINLYVNKSDRPVHLEEIMFKLGLEKNEVLEMINNILKQGRITSFFISNDEKVYIRQSIINEWEKIILRETNSYLEQKPLEPGINRESVHSMLFSKLSLKEYNGLIRYWVNKKTIILENDLYIAPYSYNKQPQGKWVVCIKSIEELYRKYKWQIPYWEKVREELKIEEMMGKQILHYMIRKGELIFLSDDIYILKGYLLSGEEKVKEWFENNDELTVAQARDLLGTTRKITIPFLEYLDEVKVTIRNGNTRRLIKAKGTA